MSELDTENDADVSSEDAPALWDVTFLVSFGDVVATTVATVSRGIRLIT